jgi:hypothetical protein
MSLLKLRRPKALAEAIRLDVPEELHFPPQLASGLKLTVAIRQEAHPCHRMDGGRAGRAETGGKAGASLVRAFLRPQSVSENASVPADS